MAIEAALLYQQALEKFDRMPFHYTIHEVMSDLDQAIMLEPNHPGCLLLRGRALYYQGQYNAAVEDFDRVIELSSDEDELITAHHLRAISVEQAGNYAFSIDDLGWMIEHGFSDDQTYAWRGYRHLQASHHIEAIHDYTQALQMRPDFEDYLLKRARAYYEIKNYTDAVKDLSRVLELNHSLSSSFLEMIHRIRGQSYYRLGRFEEALADLNEMRRMEGAEPFATLEEYLKTIANE